MTVSHISRYYETTADRYIALRKSRGTSAWRSYIAKDWDTFDHLAQRVYGDPGMYWAIADLNPHVPFPDRIPPGTELRLPL